MNRTPATRLIGAFLLVVTLLAGGLASPASAKGGEKKSSSDDSTQAEAVERTRRTKKRDETSPTTTTTVAPTTTTTATTTTTVAPTTTTETLTQSLDTAEIANSGYDPVAELGSMYNVVDEIGARALWENGVTGEGIDVAVIDTGVAPVPALDGADKVVAMVDLSFESGVPEARYLDTYGHGTHMAGIIAGRQPGADPAESRDNPDDFFGVAPDAGIVSVKVGDNTGAVDVSQVIAAIDWVVQHRNDNGLNIRVINLSYSTDGSQDYRIDPLAAAVENAWHHGIVVVVAAGNDGWMSRDGLANPAYDPYVIAVGASESTEYGAATPSWTSVGDWYSVSADEGFKLFWQDGFTGRVPDVIAPGAHIDSLRAPYSRVDLEHPEGYVTDELFRGSGTSQAAAVVSGATALLLQARPELTPDEVKALLRETAEPLKWTSELSAGQGLVDATTAATSPIPENAAQNWQRSSGLGSIEASRGGQHVEIDGVVIEGEMTVFGEEWDAEDWIEESQAGTAWEGARWTGDEWSDASWMDDDWSGVRWTGASWTGDEWTGVRWTGVRWTGVRWTNDSWTGARWTGDSWTGVRWSGASWTGVRWS